MNFRQRIRNLREECDDDSSLLASSDDAADVPDDGSFTIARRNKRGRKSKISTPAHQASDSVRVPSIIANLSLDEIRPASDILTNPESEECEIERLQPLAEFHSPERTKQSEIETVLQLQIVMENSSGPNMVFNEEMLSKTAEQKLNHVECAKNTTSTMDTLTASNDEKKKLVWCNTSRSEVRRVVDANTECSICFLPLSDKVTLEECGHCFHSECIRLWMKRKNTCPFCAGFSLLPEEFPRLG